MQIYDLLIEDHLKIKGLIEALLQLEPDAFELREGLVAQIKEEFVPHARAEESILYNSLRCLEGLKDLALESYEEHMEIEILLKSLLTRPSFDPQWYQSAKELKQALEDHIYHEENELFRIARNLFTEEEAEKMAKAFEQLKPEVQNEGLLDSTMETVVNLMPTRFAASLRELNVNPQR